MPDAKGLRKQTHTFIITVSRYLSQSLYRKQHLIKVINTVRKTITLFLITHQPPSINQKHLIKNIVNRFTDKVTNTLTICMNIWCLILTLWNITFFSLIDSHNKMYRRIFRMKIGTNTAYYCLLNRQGPWTRIQFISLIKDLFEWIVILMCYLIIEDLRIASHCWNFIHSNIMHISAKKAADL